MAANITATAERQLQESEGRIPPLTQRQAFEAYGRGHVNAWVEAGTVHPIRKGVKGVLYLHSELENSRTLAMIAARGAKAAAIMRRIQKRA